MPLEGLLSDCRHAYTGPGSLRLPTCDAQMFPIAGVRRAAARTITEMSVRQQKKQTREDRAPNSRRYPNRDQYLAASPPTLTTRNSGRRRRGSRVPSGPSLLVDRVVHARHSTMASLPLLWFACTPPRGTSHRAAHEPSKSFAAKLAREPCLIQQATGA